MNKKVKKINCNWCKDRCSTCKARLNCWYCEDAEYKEKTGKSIWLKPEKLNEIGNGTT